MHAFQAVPVITADAYDYSALASMAQSTSVVINVAGPCELHKTGWQFLCCTRALHIEIGQLSLPELKRCAWVVPAFLFHVLHVHTCNRVYVGQICVPDTALHMNKFVFLALRYTWVPVCAF